MGCICSTQPSNGVNTKEIENDNNGNHSAFAGYLQKKEDQKSKSPKAPFSPKPSLAKIGESTENKPHFNEYKSRINSSEPAIMKGLSVQIENNTPIGENNNNNNFDPARLRSQSKSKNTKNNEIIKPLSAFEHDYKFEFSPSIKGKVNKNIINTINYEYDVFNQAKSLMSPLHREIAAEMFDKTHENLLKIQYMDEEDTNNNDNNNDNVIKEWENLSKIAVQKNLLNESNVDKIESLLWKKDPNNSNQIILNDNINSTYIKKLAQHHENQQKRLSKKFNRENSNDDGGGGSSSSLKLNEINELRFKTMEKKKNR